MKRSIFDKAAEGYGVPKETLMNLTKLSFAENRELYIENHNGLIEYTDDKIRIKTKGAVISISGADFKISYIDKFDLLIEGVFSSVCFEH